MKGSMSKGCIVVFLFLVTWALGSLEPAAAEGGSGGTAAAPPALQVEPGVLRGKIFSVTGRPLNGIPVAVYGTGKKLVARCATGKDGGYRLAGLGEGTYRLEIGGHNLGTLVVKRGPGISMVDAVLPPRSRGDTGADRAPQPSRGVTAVMPVRVSGKGVVLVLRGAEGSAHLSSGTPLGQGRPPSPKKPPPQVSP